MTQSPPVVDPGEQARESMPKPTPPDVRPSRYRLRMIFFALAAIALGLHYAGFHSPMIYDSRAFLSDNANVFARHNMLEVISLAHPRPFCMMTFYANYLLTGMEPFYFRLLNALILAGAGFVLGLMTLVMLEIPALRGHGTSLERRVVCFLIGLVFVVHPLQTLVVLYVWQRAAIMASLFYLAAMAAYLAGRSSRGLEERTGYVLTGALFFVGILSKENLITLPVMLVLAELILLKQSFRQVIRRAVAIGFIVLPSLLVYLLVVRSLYGPDSLVPQGVPARLAEHFSLSGLSILGLVRTECRVLFSYLYIIVAPFLSNLQLFNPQVISGSLLDPPETVFAVLGLALLLAMALILWRRKPLTSFGLLFFIITVIPESLLNPQYLFFSFRAILPMVGLLLVLADAILSVLDFARERHIGKAGVLAVAVAFTVYVPLLAATTVGQARSWEPRALFEAHFQRLPPLSPNTEVVPYLDILLCLSSQLLQEEEYLDVIEALGRLVPPDAESTAVSSGGGTNSRNPGQDIEKALMLDRAARIHPGKTAMILSNMGVANLRMGNNEAAEKLFQRALKVDPRSALAFFHLGVLAKTSGDLPRAIEMLTKSVRGTPRWPLARYLLAEAQEESGSTQEAIENYRKIIALDPTAADAFTNLGLIFEQLDKPDLALPNHEKALKLMPQSAEKNFNLANALQKLGNVKESMTLYLKAIELKPDYAEAYANLGAALLTLGKFREAVNCFRRALAVEQDNADYHNGLGVAYAELGEVEQARQHFVKALTINPKHVQAGDNLAKLPRQAPVGPSTFESPTDRPR